MPTVGSHKLHVAHYWHVPGTGVGCVGIVFCLV